MSSDSEDGSSDEEYEFDLLAMELFETAVGNFSTTRRIAKNYYSLYLNKAEPRTSRLSGMGWVQETLATPGECYKMLRMNGHTFVALHDRLVSKYKLEPTMHMHTLEALAIFLYILGDGSSNQRAQNRFKHSGETISRKFE
jgi:hypothetical protein